MVDKSQVVNKLESMADELVEQRWECYTADLKKEFTGWANTILYVVDLELYTIYEGK